MKDSLNLIYKKLHSFFGPQHWWPGDSPFEVMVGAILTQNTNWQNVEKAITNLKKERLLQPQRLYKLNQKKLAALIRPAGYYNIKAKRLKEFLRFYFKSYKNSLRKIRAQGLKDLRLKLLAVHGVGPETADSILLYALNKPIFVVDSYTKRILSRHRLIKEGAGYDEVQNLFMQNLNPITNPTRRSKICNGARKDASHVRNTKRSKDRQKISNVVKLFNEYHALLVRLGKDLCLKNKPRCEQCPLK